MARLLTEEVRLPGESPAEVMEPPSGGLRVLVADDSPVSRRLLQAVLRKWGYQVTAVSNGTDAWKLLSGPESPQLAILDWMMPGMSGPEVCRQVRQLSREHYTYLILLTSRHEKEDLIAGMESGADEYLVKPFDNNELRARLGPGKRIVELQSELLKAHESLRLQATRDSLTTLWNRHAIYEMLNRELARAYRESTGFGIVMADLDRFKLINDTYGHVAGDAVLREISARLRSVVRTYDAVGRYGGEEFLILLPGCDIEAAFQTAERLRERIQAEPITFATGISSRGQGSIPVTASFGVTAMIRGRHASPEQVIRCADEALYAAKQQGRNRTIALPFSQQ